MKLKKLPENILMIEYQNKLSKQLRQLLIALEIKRVTDETEVSLWNSDLKHLNKKRKHNTIFIEMVAVIGLMIAAFYTFDFLALLLDKYKS